MQALESKRSRPASQFKRVAAIYAATLPLIVLAHVIGLIALVPALVAIGVIVAANLAMYAFFASGLNLRLADPSLTLVQVLVSVSIIMMLAYSIDRERSLVLVWLLLVMLFGIFKFNRREFIITTLYMLAGYALVINLLMHFKPDTVEVYIEWYQWAWLAVVLPSFALIGARISALRSRILLANAELSSALSTIQQMATHDSLTSLPNRALFNESLNHAIARADRGQSSVALMFIDLDRFKHVNDTLGHSTGDTVLRCIGQRLAATVRESDLLARLGGDEFVMLVESTINPANLEQIGRKLLAAVAVPVSVQGHDITFTASIGVAVYPADGRDMPALVANADLAMYRAKDSGRGRLCFFTQEMGIAATDRFDIEKALRQALERSEFEVFYQPKVNIAHGRLTGVEALLRWRHPERGLLLPSQFIGVAEDSGLIIQIGMWALRKACQDSRKWDAAGLSPMSMAVNLSPAQFYDDNLIAEVSRVLKETGMPPSLLELEITESMLIKSATRAAEMMQRLRRLGVRLAIDDFGTGYSSLTYLKQFAVDNLKIDRSFVRDLPDSRDDLAITRAVIALAHSMSMNVVAEGVESRGQLDALHAEGCDEFQGFFCRPAMPEPEMAALMSEYSRGKRLV